MHVNLVGINHHTAPVAVREKVAIGGDRLPGAYEALQSYLPRGVILSTCNRTEVYTIEDNGTPADKASLAFLESQLDIPNVDLRKYVYSETDQAAVEHLFRVACGLDSMVVGEYEVLGQVRQALETGEDAGMVDLPLRHVFQNAVRTGRKVREETGISRNPLSASSVAVDLAANAVGDLQGCKLMVLGAGDAGRLVAKVAVERGVSNIVVANRTRERARELAGELGGSAIGFEEMANELGDTDIVVGCSGAPHWILSAHHVEMAMKQRPDQPVVIIDIAVPRDVEPATEHLENVHLHNIDSLTEIADINRKQREGEISRVTGMIDTEVEKFASWWRTYEVRPVISALMTKADEIRTNEMNRALKRLRDLNDEEMYSLDAMTRAIVAKLLQEPIQYIKTNGRGNGSVRVINRLFGLDGVAHE
jgi:glutamyl-tRNA reductase